MPIFTYKATNPKNQIETGVVTAKNKNEAAEAIGRKNLTPVTIREDRPTIQFSKSVPAVEKITFVRYLATMLASGISLSEGMSALLEETHHPMMKKIISDIGYSLDRGQSLSSVFAKYPNVFDRLFITLTQAGEVSGNLAETLSYLEEGLRAEYSLSQKIKGAMVYPAVVFIAMFGIAIIMFFFILPQIAKVFLTMKLPLPATTEFLFRTSLALTPYTIAIIIGIVSAIVGAALFLKSKRGKKVMIALISPLPVVKSILKQLDLARFTRIFSTLLRSAVPITESLEISLSSLSWPKYRSMSNRVRQEVEQGKSVAEAFKSQKAFPAILTQMLATGEKSGTLDKTLADLARFYEQEVEESVKRATELLEPVLMLLVGIGVGATILSIISPLYSVVGSLQNVR